jgi:glycerophosphoryl diester phosphodiesterase
VIDVVKECAPEMVERMWLCGPQWEGLLPLRGHGAKLVESTRLSRMKEGPERRAATLREQSIDAVNMHHSDWNGGMVALFHRFDRVAFGWDMQEPHILQAAFRMGLDGVYSDWVDRMIEVYKAEIGQPPSLH